jgi:hypothetical protein
MKCERGLISGQPRLFPSALQPSCELRRAASDVPPSLEQGSACHILVATTPAPKSAASASVYTLLVRVVGRKIGRGKLFYLFIIFLMFFFVCLSRKR